MISSSTHKYLNSLISDHKILSYMITSNNIILFVDDINKVQAVPSQLDRLQVTYATSLVPSLPSSSTLIIGISAGIFLYFLHTLSKKK